MAVTQCDRILRHLNDFGSITASEAMEQYGCMRLAERIADLRATGVDIQSDTASGKNRYGDTTHYAVYRLKEDKT